MSVTGMGTMLCKQYYDLEVDLGRIVENLLDEIKESGGKPLPMSLSITGRTDLQGNVVGVTAMMTGFMSP